MRRTRLFPRAGQPLDLSRNYYLREDETFSEIPVQVIPLPEPPAPPSVPAYFTKSAPLHSATSLSPDQPSAKMTNDKKKPTSPKHKAQTSGTKPSNQQDQAAILFTEILRQIYAPPTNASMQMDKTTLAGCKRDQKKKMEEEPIDDEPTNKKKRGRPPNASKIRDNSKHLDKAAASGCREDRQNKQQKQPTSCEPTEKKRRGRPPKMSANYENRKLEEQVNISKQENKGKGGWQKGKPRNLEKRLTWEQKQYTVKHNDQQENADREKRTREATNCEQAKKGKTGWEKGKPRNLKKRKLWEEAKQQSSEATEETAGEHRTPNDTQDEKPMAAEQMHQEEPMLKPPEEPIGNTESKKTAILAGLTNVMLQMTKITADIAHLISMASGGLEDN